MVKKEKFQIEERRDSVRAQRIITVRHRLYKHKNRRLDSIWQLATTENMSVSGLLFTSVLPYQVGDLIELQVVMSGVLDIFNGFGRVVRTIRNKAGYWKVGVKYVDLKTRRRPAKTVLPSKASKSS